MLEVKLSDTEIRELWAEHFPKRHDDAKSNLVCCSLRLFVELRAGHTGAAENDVIFELHQVLNGIGIPPAEFYPAAQITLA